MRHPQVDFDILRHILKYCDNIDVLIARFGNDFEVFKIDLAYRDAVSMNILQIGELSGHLSEEFRVAHSEIPWRAIKGMRNLFAHSYGSMDMLTVWSTATESIPVLRDFCRVYVIKNPIDENNEDVDI